MSLDLDINGSISAELELVLTILANNQSKLIQCLSHDLDWGLVVELAIRHRVYPLVYRKLSAHDAILPAKLATLKQLDAENKLKALRLAHESVQLIKHFEQNNIQAVIIKGAPLAYTLYSDITLRPCRDIDVVIDVKDIYASCAILKSLGYSQIQPDFELTPWRLKYYIKNNIEFGFVNHTTGIYVEPHWQLSYLKYVMPVFAHKQYLSFYSQSIPILAMEDNFIYLCVHAAAHCFWRLRWLNDIALILNQADKFNWHAVDALAVKMRATSPVFLAIFLANQLLAAPIPEVLREYIVQDYKTRKLAKLVLKFITSNTYLFDGNVRHSLFYIYRYYCYYILPDWRSRLQFMLVDWFKLDRTIAAVNIPDRLAFIYYIIHPFMVVGRLLGVK